jgi:uncharacterized protein involved in exopolysaccharide biosynthesis
VPLEHDVAAPIGFARAILRQRKFVLTLPLVTFVAAVLIGLLLPKEYAAVSTIRPQAQPNAAAPLAGVASQLGINIPGTVIGDPVKFYAAMLHSLDLERQVVLTRYRFPATEQGTDTLTGNLVELFHPRGSTEAQRTRRAIKKLEKVVEVTTDREAGLVMVRVETRWPALSEAINRRYLDLLNDFNLRQRQSTASAERQFAEKRLAEAQSELYASEDAVEQFLQSNKRYQDSPTLLADFSRLQRRVDLRQQVFTALSQSYEHARLDEVRNTPVLTVVDNPELSAQKVGSVVLDAVIWTILAIIVAVAIAFGREFVAQQRREHPAEYEEIRDLMRVGSFNLLPSRRPRRYTATSER